MRKIVLYEKSGIQNLQLLTPMIKYRNTFYYFSTLSTSTLAHFLQLDKYAMFIYQHLKRWQPVRLVIMFLQLSSRHRHQNTLNARKRGNHCFDQVDVPIRHILHRASLCTFAMPKLNNKHIF